MPETAGRFLNRSTVGGHNISVVNTNAVTLCARPVCTTPTPTPPPPPPPPATPPILLFSPSPSRAILFFAIWAFRGRAQSERPHNVRPRLREARDNNNSPPEGAQHAELARKARAASNPSAICTERRKIKHGRGGKRRRRMGSL